ncbi:hypothetical protein B0A52_01330 [Exophiala mesophila]|uniref:DH domain-containing protein n=1 Tax=Exophiala mesophila TaxID=212818 RepID=A0A438NH58_EXOME|nr:hypothetical protein B0A52_01330 [Exophiala mesophila]
MSKSGNLAALSAVLNPSDKPTIYYAEDPPYLPRILIFYSPVQAVGSLSTTSRIRATILSAAGFKSFGAFSVAPNSSYYSAVHKLPEDRQRDDVCRGIAFALCRYFSEVPTEVKNAIAEEVQQDGLGLKWGQSHAAQVTCRMSKVLNTDEILDALRPFSKDRPTSPISPVKPLASIRKTRPSFLPADAANIASTRHTQTATPGRRVPSGKSTRSTSTSTPGPRNSAPKHSLDQLESLRFKMCEFVDTEDRYITRLQDLIDLVTTQGRTPKSLTSKFASSRNQKAVNAMIQFPSLLDQIKDINLAFLDDIETALQNSEDAALTFLEEAQSNPGLFQNSKDPMGIYTFAKVLLAHFPKFPMPYREYLDLHAQISSNLTQYLKEGTTSVQQAPSLLMEPAQRISRYGLYIDTMLPHVPTHFTVAVRALEKARKIIAEICEMEPAASTILDSLRIEHEFRKGALSPTKLLSGLTRSNGTVREAPALTGSTRDRDKPRFFPSLGRSLSRRPKSTRPGLSGILSEQDPDQASNINSSTFQISTRSDENRPLTGSSGISFRSLSTKRPQTAGSSRSAPSPGPTLPILHPNKSTNSPEDGSITREVDQYRTIEEYKVALIKAEDENYKLLQQNADLKRQIRECKCGGAVRK